MAAETTKAHFRYYQLTTLTFWFSLRAEESGGKCWIKCMQYVISFAPTYNIFTFHSSLTRSSYFVYFPTSEIDTKALKGNNIDIGIDF